jgi:hypothetical protein
VVSEVAFVMVLPVWLILVIVVVGLVYKLVIVKPHEKSEHDRIKHEKPDILDPENPGQRKKPEWDL